MGLWGGQTEFQKVTAYLPAFACPIMQANLEFALNGVYEGLSAVIIPAICDTLRCMTQNWRFGVTSIPMVPIVYPQNRTSLASVDYLVSEFETVLTMLSTITGQMMNEKALCRTIEVYNEHNAAMREFAQVANDHLDVVTPRVRHTVFKSAFFFEKEEHTAIVKEITAALKEQAVCNWAGKRFSSPASPSSPMRCWTFWLKTSWLWWGTTWPRRAGSTAPTPLLQGAAA